MNRSRYTQDPGERLSLPYGIENHLFKEEGGHYIYLTIHRSTSIYIYMNRSRYTQDPGERLSLPYGIENHLFKEEGGEVTYI